MRKITIPDNNQENFENIIFSILYSSTKKNETLKRK